MQPLRRPWNPASTCRMTRAVLRAAALSLAMAAAALATDHPIEGDRLLLTDPSSPARRVVRFRAARDPAIDPRAAADPRSVGATLEIAGSGAGDGASGTISLDPGRWTGLGRPAGAAGYRWDDRAATNGIRRVMFRKGVKNTGMLVVTGGGVAWPYRVTQPQVAIDVRFTVGTNDVYCAHFTSFSRNAPPRVLGSDAPPPSSCGSIPPGPCGNGLAEGTEECDDGNAVSGDGCSASCQLENSSAICGRHPDRRGRGDQGGARRLRPRAPDLRHRTAARSEPALHRGAAGTDPGGEERPPAGDRLPRHHIEGRERRHGAGSAERRLPPRLRDQRLLLRQ